jgi:arginine decarboxylase-like protein
VPGPSSRDFERIQTDEDHPLKARTIRDSLDLYHVLDWGSGFFAINDTGDVEVRPKTDDARSCELLELVKTLVQYEQGLKGYTYLSGQA